MPNRIIKESICTSDTIDCLSAFEEVVFYRLIVNCDDFGRCDARAKVLSAKLFPLKDIPAEQMQSVLNSLCNAGLITVYLVDDRPYLQMNTWNKHQTTRAKKSKYPAPNEGICMQMHADESECMQMSPYSLYENRNTNNDARAREEEINPYGDSDYRPDQGTVQQYAVNSFSPFGYRAMQDLNSFVDDLGEDVVRHAIDNTLDNGARNWSYCKSILNGYVEAGVKTVGEAKTVDEEFRKSKSKGGHKQKQEPKEPVEKAWEDMTPAEQEYALAHGPFGRFY